MNCVESYLKSHFSQSDKVALAFLDKNINKTSFKQLHKYCILAQKYYKEQGIVKGDTVLIFETLSAELYAMIIGALGLGINLLVVEPWMKNSSVNQAIKQSEPKAIISSFLGKLVALKFNKIRKINIVLGSKKIHDFNIEKSDTIECIEMKADDTALTAYTSGTSGIPKGVSRTHEYLIDQNTVIKKYVHYNKFSKLDLTIFTNMVLLNLNLGKGSLIVQKPWSNKTIKVLDNLKGDLEVDTLACGPAFLKILSEKTKNLELRQIYTGGALADVSIHETAVKRWMNADLYHVYGSSEAEPVAVCDLALAVKKSQEKGYFKNRYLGEVITEITPNVQGNDLWVTGPHVSSHYLNDEIANQKLKHKDDQGRIWHNMGDRVELVGNSLWYEGRGFQDTAHFILEQAIYKLLGHSKAFIMELNHQITLFGEDVEKESKQIKNKFPEIVNIYNRNIIVDDRHRARINRQQSFYKGTTMKNIMMFMINRVPLIANIIIVWGMMKSVEILHGIELTSNSFWYAMISLVIFITELRFMDELKDFEKDKIAHPTRPLPSGSVTTKQVGAMVNIGLISLIVCSILGFWKFGNTTGLLMSVVTVWLYLMYKEFFVGEALSKSPLLYAISHQVIIIPAVLLLVSLQGDNSLIFNSHSFGFSLFILGSFFSFEVGRKMNPNSHPVLETYYYIYGKIKAHILLLSLLLLALLGGYLFDACTWPTVAIGLVFTAQFWLYYKENKYKAFEGIISLYLIYAVWMLPLMEWVE